MTDCLTASISARDGRERDRVRPAFSLPALVLAVAAPVVAAVAGAWPHADQPLAVMVAPSATAGDAMRVVAAAGGMLVAATAFDTIVIARSPSPDFVGRLFAAGAWIVVAAPSGCSPHRPPNASLAVSKDLP